MTDRQHRSPVAARPERPERPGRPGNWLRVLVSALGVFEILMAAGAGPGGTVAVGLVGGIALVAAPWWVSGPVRSALLLVGTVPFAALTWWSAATPLLAVVALTIGLAGNSSAANARGGLRPLSHHPEQVESR